MELDWALLNREQQQRIKAAVCWPACWEQTGPEAVSQSQIRRRAGAVRDAVLRALAEADEPLRAREIHAAAATLAGEPLSWNTVKDCLHKNARRPDGVIERVSHGRYRRGVAACVRTCPENVPEASAGGDQIGFSLPADPG